MDAYHRQGLADLPTEILELITSALPGGSTLKLWNSGDTRLQSKFAAGGVTEMVLEDFGAATTSRFPTVLSALRHLRKLHLNRRDHGLGDVNYVKEQFRKLSPSLEHLYLQAFQATKFLNLESDESVSIPREEKEERPGVGDERDLGESKQVESRNQRWNLSRFFPRLRTLEYREPTDGEYEIMEEAEFEDDHLQYLPTESLTDLQVTIGRFSAEQLPRSLLRLGVFHPGGCSPYVCFKDLPPHLTELATTGKITELDELFDFLPPSITALSVHVKRQSAAFMEKLPAKLMRLHITGSWLDLHSLQALPRTLTFLELKSHTTSITPNHMRSLPRCLLHLTLQPLSMSWCDITKEDWPPHLQTLKCPPDYASCYVRPHFASLLPQSLNTIQLGHLVVLPENLTEKDTYRSAFPFAKKPGLFLGDSFLSASQFPRLRNFQLSDATLSWILARNNPTPTASDASTTNENSVDASSPSIPTSLHKLIAEGSPLVFPPFLTSLKLKLAYFPFSSLDFWRSLPRFLSSLQLTPNWKLCESMEEKLLTCAVISSLPRSLTEFQSTIRWKLERAAIAFLPPDLRILSLPTVENLIGDENLDEETAGHFPKSLVTLDLGVLVSASAVIAALPRGLRRLTLSVVADRKKPWSPEEWGCFPPALRYLVLKSTQPTIPLEGLKYLPRRLLELDMPRLVEELKSKDQDDEEDEEDDHNGDNDDYAWDLPADLRLAPGFLDTLLSIKNDALDSYRWGRSAQPPPFRTHPSKN